MTINTSTRTTRWLLPAISGAVAGVIATLVATHFRVVDPPSTQFEIAEAERVSRHAQSIAEEPTAEEVAIAQRSAEIAADAAESNPPPSVR